MANKKRYTATETKKMMPAIKEFNTISKIFLRLLGRKVAQKEKKVASIAILISDMALPQNNYNISIQTIDINDTRVKRKGAFSFQKKMNWEDDLRHRKRGTIL